MQCVEKDRDTFPTTYAKDYIWHDSKDKTDLYFAPDAFALTKEERKEFIDLNAIKEIPWEEQLEIIKNLYAQRMKTTYYVSYCEKLASKKKMSNIETEEELGEDTLLSTSDKIYAPKSQKLLEPLATSRRVMGYCRPALYYTGLSEYQDEYGKRGYQRLIPTRDQRLKQRLPFCDKYTSKH